MSIARERDRKRARAREREGARSAREALWSGLLLKARSFARVFGILAFLRACSLARYPARRVSFRSRELPQCERLRRLIGEKRSCWASSYEIDALFCEIDAQFARLVLMGRTRSRFFSSTRHTRLRLSFSLGAPFAIFSLNCNAGTFDPCVRRWRRKSKGADTSRRWAEKKTCWAVVVPRGRRAPPRRGGR